MPELGRPAERRLQVVRADAIGDPLLCELCLARLDSVLGTVDLTKVHVRGGGFPETSAANTDVRAWNDQLAATPVPAIAPARP